MVWKLYDITDVPPESTANYIEDAVDDGDWILNDSNGFVYAITDLSSNNDSGQPTQAYASAFTGGHSRQMYILGAIENVQGSFFIDVINGNNLDNNLFGDDDINDHGSDGIGGTDTITGLGGDDYIFGGADADEIDGGTDNDTLEGGLGGDAILGGAGKDIFFFASALAANVDVIDDFKAKDDTFYLDNVVFAKLKAGKLAASAFESNKSGRAEDGTDRIIYETDTGELYFDRDGKGGKAAVEFATIDKNSRLGHDDFKVVHDWEINVFA
ncbi:calcium-binding protein [Rhizobium sp. LjRoot254]|uniref:calcium-binding protein n=1 Tax=Rhizobium sp. LjRoot254 TaxID=3342297 RepID=UPI003ECDE254